MAEMLLINPRRRRRKSTGKAKRRRSTSRRRRNPIALARASNPVARRRARRRNPIANLRLGRHRRRRRSNPIRLGGLNGSRLMDLFKDAAIGGAGAIVMDVVQGQLNGFLPATFQTSRTEVGIGDAVKAVVTALLGTMGAKATKGLSLKMAKGALAVQAYEVLSAIVPSTMTLGYGSPARIVNGSQRVGPTRGGMLQAYQRPGGRTPLLSAAPLGAYVTGRTPLLSGMTAQRREGVTSYR